MFVLVAIISSFRTNSTRSERCTFQYPSDVLSYLQGLFRLAGSELRIKRLRKEFDERVSHADLNLQQQGVGVDDEPGATGGGGAASASAAGPTAHVYDPHVLAGVVKRYLRELPEPLLCTSTLERSWLTVHQSIGYTHSYLHFFYRNSSSF